MPVLGASGSLKFVAVRTPEGDHHYHLTNLYDVTLQRGETIVARAEVPLTGEVAEILASLEGAMQFAIPSELLPEDAIADFLKVFFKAGFEAQRADSPVLS